MKQLIAVLTLFTVFTGSSFCWSAESTKSDCPIYPVPKVYRSLGKTIPLAKDAAIVLSATASQQDQYAAERLRDRISLRFGLLLPILREDAVSGHSQLILLGRPDTHRQLTKVLRESKVVVTEKDPGHNGFAIEFYTKDKIQYILLAGSDNNGVIYSQEAFFDLLKKEKEKVVMTVVSCRDWPSIPWRGRPHSVLKHHLLNGELDAYIRARLNFSDLRDDPAIKESLLFSPRKASMGIPPGKPMDKKLLSTMIEESHRRGLFLYGTVSCSVPLEKFDVLKKTYEELLELGADGLWVSMDDTGGGSDPITLVKKIMEFCKSRGITGRKIAFTPPLHEYKTIDRPLNHQLAKLPIFDDAVWYFTRVPCEGDRQMAEKIGLKKKPAWWYNYVETGSTYDGKSGFLHTSWLVTPLRKDNRPGYMDFQPITWGWDFPECDKIRDAAKNTDQVHLWGLCGGFPTEYAMVAFGLWAWDPEQFDFQQLRRSVYRYVYGDALVETLCQFDDKLGELKRLYRLASGWRYNPANDWPRLADPKNRDAALKLLAELDPLMAKISKEAPKESALNRKRLEYSYLEPMKASLEYAKKFATFDYLDYQFADLEQRFKKLAFDNKTAEFQKLMSETKPVIEKNLEAFRSTFAELKGVDLYVAKWQKLFTTDLEYWVKAERTRVYAAFAKMNALPASAILPYLETKQEETLQSLFKTIDQKAAKGTVLKTFTAADWLKKPFRIKGNSVIGLFKREKFNCLGIGLPQHTPTKAGDRATVQLTTPVPKYKEGRLYLDFFAADTRVDDSARNYRRLSMSVNDKTVWQRDIAPDQRGQEWESIDITKVIEKAKTLRLCFAVEELKPVGHHSSIVFLGPVRLRVE